MQLAAHKEPSISAVSVSALLIGRDCALDAFATRRGDLSALDILIVATVVQANLASIATPDAQAAMASRIPQAELRMFEGGHMFLLEDRAAFPAVIAFLETPQETP